MQSCDGPRRPSLASLRITSRTSATTGPPEREPRGPQARWPLRTTLVAVLAALLATSAVFWGPGRDRIAGSTRPTASAPTVTSPPATAPPQTPGPPSRPFAARGCGLSLSALPPAPVGRCSVLEIGDSLGNDIGWGMARVLGAGSGLDMIQQDKSATGLVDKSYYDWPAELPGLIASYHPELVVVCMGGNDQQGLVVDGRAVQFPAPAWQAAYLGLVHQLLAEATSGGAYVLWIGLPIMAQPSYSQGVQILDGLYEQAVGSQPGAMYLDTWHIFSGPGGFSADAVVNGAPTSLRAPDGIHLSLAGENVAATYVIDQIASIYHVQVTPTAPSVITGW